MPSSSAKKVSAEIASPEIAPEMAEIGGGWRPAWAIGAEAREGVPPGVVVLLVVLLAIVAAVAVAVVVVVPLATWAPTSGESIGHRLTPEERESMPA